MDMLNIRRKTIHDLVQEILNEAWTPERKDQITATFIKRGFTFVEHKQIGDFDLSLWSYPDAGLLRKVYAVGLNNAQHDPGDTVTQRADVPVTPFSRRTWSDVVNVLTSWTEKHGRLLIASGDLGKLKRYRSLLYHSFDLVDYSETEPKRGFFILPPEDLS